MQQHVKILGWLFIIFSAFFVAVGFFILAVLGGVGVLSGDREAMYISGAVGVAVACILLILSVPGIVAGLGLFKYQQWARILAIILGALHLLSFPLGTALGIYTFWVLFNAQTILLFERPPT
jgi:hypothetical protein